MKLLVIEDHKDLLDTVIIYFKKEDYICETASDTREALEKIELFEYDCILLDLMLPDGNGLEILRHIKSYSPETSVIIVSAKNSLDHKLTGLDDGADDYMTKPFSLPELHSRIKAVLRRKMPENNRFLNFNEIHIDLQSKECKINNNILNLTKKELNLLIYFINNQNRMLSKQSIASHLWGDYTYSMDNVDFVYQHLKNIRKKITDAGCKDYLQTVYGLGYKWIDR
ncbi:DNA-binding response regulator, OmpR family, contains REC and winged-helix (wHTH) domain [Chryseobacterium wanjuense]|jgi:DNA-binding response OmpR family regulator|uniref:DNA-binding response regulator, OmpR family, contains REC and winged-helix (WHTH) domain n=1 Tax=Chryseobacterium wanjuense TaxID=356305 RepID=A0A1I0MJZ1_9FLAO|nr:response regulator transcription factor [Chryseobacterium wanjuense]SEV88650.1 DNA-binding response regulator, OmpR family, contains REC and winged-helix (wHTH) domain [Chryseobacterium wanjuense]